MIHIIFSIFLLAIIFFINTKKKKTLLAPSNIIVGLYLLSVVCAIPFAYINDDKAIFSSHYFFHAVIFLFYLLLFIVPFCLVQETSIRTLIIPNKKIVRVFSLVIIGLSLYAIFFFVSGVVNVFAYGDLGAARNVRYEQDVTFVGGGITYTIASVASSLYPFAIALFFINTIIEEKKWIRLLLLVSSFSETLHILTEVGRDGAVFWLFTFTFLWLFFKPFLKDNQLSRIKVVFVVLGIIVTVPFILITVGRFGDNSENTFFAYFGQQFSQVCYTIDIDPLPVRPGGSFPLYYEVTKQPMPRDIYIDNNLVDSTAFGTFVRTFLLNFGYGGMLLLGIILAFMVKNMVKVNKGTFYFYRIFVYILLFQIYSQGVFYFRQYHRGGNLFIVLCFVFYLLFKIIQESSSNIKIQSE